ncbi:glycerol dehydratase reactivase beta/small subunit family protein [Telmatospirillum siberiense]|uniref:Propanediol dehydratase n=1 Tax=Telmatospirillum siberiense TaxID=382514 RepID=A0A2N3PUK6_9PROT|nr:glycerol dehydratase reactivase beta/small subunit family protein [Telmatospirillum siberiense]PKU24076.1 hypothetical protein CWS72_13335 [Telmatospirillum siberiense]
MSGMDDISLVAARRPAVQIVTCRADALQMQPILWGIEEEEIPAELTEMPAGTAVALAHQAAHMSSLNVGIGINGIDDVVVLHHRDLPAEKPLFVVERQSMRVRELRNIGKNAARLVKGDPMVFDEENMEEETSPKMSPDELESIVSAIVRRLANK